MIVSCNNCIYEDFHAQVQYHRPFCVGCNPTSIFLKFLSLLFAVATNCDGEVVLLFEQSPAERVKAKMKLQLSEAGNQFNAIVHFSSLSFSGCLNSLLLFLTS